MIQDRARDGRLIVGPDFNVTQLFDIEYIRSGGS